MELFFRANITISEYKQGTVNTGFFLPLSPGFLNRNTICKNISISSFLPFLLPLLVFSQDHNGFFSEKSFTSNSSYVIQYWNSENGLPQNSVASLLQTRDGFLWIGTFNGLTRFDGFRFITYTTENTGELAAGGALKMVDTDEGLIFVDSKGNLMRFRNNRFRFLLPENFRHLRADLICEGKKGEIFFTTYDHEIYLFSENSVELVTSVKTKNLKGIEYIEKSGIVLLLDTTLMIYSNGKLSGIDFVSGKVLNSLFKANDSTVIVTYRNGIMEIRNGKTRPVPWEGNYSPHRVFYLNDQKMVIGNFFSGCAIVDGETVSFIDKTNGLTSDAVNALLVDRENNIWVATNDAGLNKISKKSLTVLSREDGMAGDAVGPIIQTAAGDIIISNFCDGLVQWRNGQLTRYPLGIEDCIWSLMEDLSQNLWIGTYLPGLYMKSGNRLQKFGMESGLPSNIIISLFRDSREILWIGTLSGVCRYVGGNFPVTGNELLNRSKIFFIGENKDGIIRAGTDNGIFFIRDSTVAHVGRKDGLLHQAVRFIHEDDDGILWICTYGGGLFRMKEGKFFSYNGLGTPMDNFLSALAEDEKGYFWITSNKGLYRVSRGDLNNFADGKTAFLLPLKFGMENGLKTEEFNGGFYPSLLKDKDGKIWFPSIHGVVIINPDDKISDDVIPDISTEKISADGADVPVNRGEITIERNTRNLEFFFTAPVFSSINNLYFQTILDGYQQEWSQPFIGRSAVYHNLAPGNYTFKIRFYGSLDRELNRETGIAFSVPYPFWQTLPFYLLSGFMLIVAGFGIYQLSIRQVRSKEKREALVRTEYSRLEMKALQSQMNPHFIFNCLNSIKYFLNVKDMDSADKYLGKFSKLIRMFLEHSRSNFVTLQEEITLLSLYIEMEQMRTERKFNFKLKVDPSVDPENTEIPAMLFQPYVENAIHHGLGNLNREGVLTISFSKNNNSVTGTVDDNGIGRKKSKEINDISSGTFKPMGLQMTQERIALLNSLQKTNITVKITDKLAPDGSADGTRVIVTIPLEDQT